MDKRIIMEDLCECLICNKRLHYISNTHLKTHNMTMKEYMDRFPDSPTRSELFNHKMNEQNKIKGKKISKYRKGKTYKELFGEERAKEIRKNVSEAHKGEKNYFYGKHLSEETKKKISLKNKGRKLKHPRSLEYRRKISESNRNRIISEETRKKLSETLKRKYASGEIISSMLGKHHSEETKKKLSYSLKHSKKRQTVMESKEYREKMSKSLSGKNNPMYGKYGGEHPAFGNKHTEKTKEIISRINKGKHLSLETKKKLSERMKQEYSSGKRISPFIKYTNEHKEEIRKRMRDNNPMKNKEIIQKVRKTIADGGLLSLENNGRWLGGKSFEPYGLAFNKKIKEVIKERDKQCMMCNTNLIILKELKRRVHIHHIDYIKINNFKENFVTLCVNCHMITNSNRNHWKTFFQSMLKERYGYQYTADQKIILDFTKEVEQ